MRFSTSVISVLLFSASTLASPHANPVAEAKIALVKGPGQNILEKIQEMWPKLQALLDDMGYINEQAQQIPGDYPKKQQILDDINPWWGPNGYLFDLLGKLRVDVETFTQTKKTT